MNADYITLKNRKPAVVSVGKAPGNSFRVGTIIYRGNNTRIIPVYLDPRLFDYAEEQGKNIYNVLGEARDLSTDSGEIPNASLAAAYSLWYGRNVKWIVDKSSETPKYNVVVNGEPLADLLRQMPKSGLESKL
ncbi:hypothetical protein DRN75_01425 [Nanoarchaeota archaeon]|nr:MAG: hypothetical protein DRN75_01425 [Nanoarchaeota archaeon]